MTRTIGMGESQREKEISRAQEWENSVFHVHVVNKTNPFDATSSLASRATRATPSGSDEVNLHLSDNTRQSLGTVRSNNKPISAPATKNHPAETNFPTTTSSPTDKGTACR